MTEVLTVPPMPGLAPVVDPRTAAQHALEQAVANLVAEKAKIVTAQQAKAAAQAVLDAAKPNIMLAEAAVTIAKAHLLQFGPLPKTTEGGGAVTCEQVLAVLRGASSQMTVEDIRAALAEDGINPDVNNLKTYLSRWAASGAVMKGQKNNRLEPARYYAPPSAASVPSMPGVAASLPEDFPGREWLVKAGITSRTDLAGATVETLTEYSGIGKATAKAIMEALS